MNNTRPVKFQSPAMLAAAFALSLGLTIDSVQAAPPVDGSRAVSGVPGRG
jgi:hypothetical protein